MQARDIMTKDVTSVSKETPVKDAVRLMVEQRISGLPVLDGNDQVVGMVTESDLLVRAKDLNIPAFLPILGGYIYMENPAKLDSEIRKATATTVEEIMTRKVHSVSVDSSLNEVATVMAKNEVNRIPVMENNKMVGIITRGDVVRAIAEEMES